MSDIYVIIQGHYSEQTVVCAFTIEEVAQSYVKEMNDQIRSDYYTYVRTDVDPPIPSVVREITQPKPPHEIVVEPFERFGQHVFRVSCKTCEYKANVATQQSAVTVGEAHLRLVSTCE